MIRAISDGCGGECGEVFSVWPRRGEDTGGGRKSLPCEDLEDSIQAEGPAGERPSEEQQGAGLRGVEREKEEAGHHNLCVIFLERGGAMEGHIMTYISKDFSLVVGGGGMQLRVTGTQTSERPLFWGTFCCDPGET